MLFISSPPNYRFVGSQVIAVTILLRHFLTVWVLQLPHCSIHCFIMLNDRLLQDESFSSEAGEEQSNKKGAEAPPSSLLQQKYLQFTIVELHFRQNHGREPKPCNCILKPVISLLKSHSVRNHQKMSRIYIEFARPKQQVLDRNLTKKSQKFKETKKIMKVCLLFS